MESKLPRAQVKHLRAIAVASVNRISKMAGCSPFDWRMYELGSKKPPRAMLERLVKKIDGLVVVRFDNGDFRTFLSEKTIKKVAVEEDGAVCTTSRFPEGRFTIANGEIIKADKWTSVNNVLSPTKQTLAARIIVANWKK